MMSQAETLISILLAVIAYLLYQIARQLTFLTGRKMKMPFRNLFPKQIGKPQPKPHREEKLPN